MCMHFCVLVYIHTSLEFAPSNSMLGSFQPLCWHGWPWRWQFHQLGDQSAREAIQWWKHPGPPPVTSCRARWVFGTGVLLGNWGRLARFCFGEGGRDFAGSTFQVRITSYDLILEWFMSQVNPMDRSKAYKCLLKHLFQVAQPSGRVHIRW